MAQDRDQLGNLTFESSPGGLFDQGDDAAARNAQEAGGESQDYALDSKGWAIGTGTGSTKGYTPTNNSKYYSERADSDAAAAAISANLAEGYRNEAQTAAAEADSDARAAANAIATVTTLVAQADSDARSADSDARAAQAAVASVDSDARAAAASATAAAGSASAAATSATNAANSETAAMGWAIDTETGINPWNTNNRGSSLYHARQSEDAQARAQQSAADALIYRNQARADSEEIAGQIAAYTAFARGVESRIDTDLVSARDAANDAAADATEAERQAVLSRRTAYISQTWAVGPGGDTDSEGTSTNNARYWAMQAMNHRPDTDVSDSEITLTAGQGITGGGAFTLNQHQNETISFALADTNVVNATRAGNEITLTYANGGTLEFTIGGGSGPSPASPHLTLSLSPSEVEQQGAGTQTVNATLTANTGFAISDQAFSISDPDNPSVPVSGTGSTRQYTISRATARTVTISATATLTRSADDSEFTHQSASAEFHIDLGWYRDLIAAAPTGINSMDNQGIWRDGEMNTQTLTANNTGRRLWYALPIRTGGYRFHSGFVVYNTTNHGNINNGSGGADEWTLYSVDDFDDSQNGSTFTVTIEEA